MLNPSTATDDVDDPTIRRVIGFTRRLGYNSLIVVNLFARRATRPAHLADPGDPVGPENDQAIASAARTSAAIIAAWGSHGADRALAPRRAHVEALLFQQRDRGPVFCLGYTKGGQPRHPLYLPADTPRVRYVPA
jgi:hypothetical protein